MWRSRNVQMRLFRRRLLRFSRAAGILSRRHAATPNVEVEPVHTSEGFLVANVVFIFVFSLTYWY